MWLDATDIRHDYLIFRANKKYDNIQEVWSGENCVGVETVGYCGAIGDGRE